MRVKKIDETRSKLKAAGTYFKSRFNGFEANDISVQVTAGSNITLTVRRDQGGNAFEYVGTEGGSLSTVVFLGNVSEIFTLTAIDHQTFTVIGSTSGSLGTAIAGKVFRSSILAFLITSEIHNPGDAFTILRNDTETFVASNFDNLRNEVVSSKLILMPARGADLGDENLSDSTPVSIPKTYLSGGSGLPRQPSSEMLVPLVFVNYREEDIGRSDFATMYKWEGSAQEGKWVLN